MKIKEIWSMSTFRLLFLVIAVVIPLNILTLILSNTAVREVELQITAETQNVLKLYMNQIDGAMERITAKMHLLAVDDADFAYINNKDFTDSAEYYNQVQAMVGLHSTFKDALQDNSLITGIYVVYPQKEFQVIRSVQTHTTAAYRDELAAYIYRVADGDGQEELGEWKVEIFGGKPMLLFTSRYKNAYYGAWMELETLAQVFKFTESGTASRNLFVAGEEIVYDSEIRVKGETAAGDNYVRVEAVSRYADFSIVELLPKSALADALPGMLRVLQVASFLALAILPVLLVLMNRWSIIPIGRLTSAMREIEAGNMDYRIEESSEGSEFEQINRNFNRMMNEVSKLKVSVYEEKLEKQQIKMRFLSQQIQPHFILNAMNILYSYEQDEYPLIQKMILCLSKYFRYIVNANSEFVELHEEMDHIRNYFEIQQVRYPETFFAMAEYDEEIADCLVPPLLIQNFAENAIKHSLKIGNRIDIFVIAQKMGDDIVRIRMLDTGEGINQELLEKVNRFRKTGEYQEGLGVGIQNAVERLAVLYGAETTFEITRDEPHGTRIEIRLPLHHAERKAEWEE